VRPNIITVEEFYKDKSRTEEHMTRLRESEVWPQFGRKGVKLTTHEVDFGVLGVLGSGMLAKFRNIPLNFECEPNTCMVKINTLLKQSEGRGASTAKGERKLAIPFNTDRDGTMLRAKNLKLSDGGYGISKTGADRHKVGSLFSTLVEWASPEHIMGYTMIDTSDVARRLAVGEDYKHMMFKGVLYLLQLSGGYTNRALGLKRNTAPQRVMRLTRDQMITASHALGDVVINLDVLGDAERGVADLLVRSYPSMIVGGKNIFSNVRLAAEKASFVTFQDSPYKIGSPVSAPDVFWRTLVNLACSLGCVNDLVYAYNVAIGSCEWLDALASVPCDTARHMDLPFPASRGVGTCYDGCSLRSVDDVEGLSNLCSSSAMLVCGEMIAKLGTNAILYQVDKYGTSNQSLFGKKPGTNKMAWSCMQEHGGFDHLKHNPFFVETRARMGKPAMIWGYEYMQRIVRNVTPTMVSKTGQPTTSFTNALFDVGVLSLVGASGNMDASALVGVPMDLSALTLSLIADPIHSHKVRAWCAVHCLSEERFGYNGLGAIGKTMVHQMTETTQKRINLCDGVYQLQHSELTGCAGLQAREGAEALEDTRINYIRTYLNWQASGPDAGVAERHVVEEQPEKEAEAAEIETTVDWRSKEAEAEAIMVEVPIVDLDDEARSKIAADVETPGGGKARRDGELHAALKGILHKHIGPNSFLEMVADDGGVVRPFDVPGDGLCGAHALHKSMELLDGRVDKQSVVARLKQVDQQDEWFADTSLARVAQENGYGLMVGEHTDDGVIRWHGYNMEGRPLSEALGVLHSGNHYYAVSPSKSGTTVFTAQNVLGVQAATDERAPLPRKKMGGNKLKTTTRKLESSQNTAVAMPPLHQETAYWQDAADVSHEQMAASDFRRKWGSWHDKHAVELGGTKGLVPRKETAKLRMISGMPIEAQFECADVDEIKRVYPVESEWLGLYDT